MRIARLIYFLFLVFYPWQSAIADQYTDTALSLLSQCYDASEEINSNITHCFNEKLNKIPNPLNYKISVHATKTKKSDHGKITVFMINAKGVMLYCIGTAGEKLKINACASDIGKPLTPEQELSIEGFF
ncbi:TPA: hypothetical protein ACJ5DT_002841 [Legionella pneumophila]|uniref:hypothetical protein n=1 Tax=Legionella pneumophila TaxID=446 RepID=UPI0004B758A2|nr:hypothetical protein [Legionella pneumophila]APF02411.1 hypothetical protein BIZ52_03155 [Legionella pneumophila subsp. fraseri]APF05421.1 hypothetical protein BIZ51_03155 [Legionella pneumophila subsp. fraseri]AUB67895.1 hypothetical protein BJK09_03160 [Legionella pneumophila]AUB70866.1 hypothetical protein BJK08_03160 [Legionella pneumophila]KXB25616.1 hypothetical protein PtVF66_08010 [Legionella pneumophila]